jgi:hypothetical protein
MENSRKILADGSGQEPEWFVVSGDKWVGPMTVSEIFEKIQTRDLSWAHFAWKEGEDGWKRLCDIEAFQAGVPSEPTRSVTKSVTQSVATSSARKAPPAAPANLGEDKVWFLHYNDTQFGPFGESEVKRFIDIGKIHGRVHAWKDPMENWARLEKIEEFKSSLGARTPAPAPRTGARASEQRATPRRPLVAKVLAASGSGVSIGMCRDVSVGGMQVLTDRIPGKVGAKVKLNVSPAGGKMGGNIEPFVAEGVIVRILEDGRGFSFRFDALPSAAKAAIEAYIASESHG